MKINKHAREEVEMLDGRKYFSTDNWQTIYRMRIGRPTEIIVTDKEEADMVRFIAVAQSSAGP